MAANFYGTAALLGICITAMALWWTGTKAKELAVDHARKLCVREGVQLLDYTVALKRMKIARSKSGSACFRRDYRFEFTAEGKYRDEGVVTLNGHTLVNVHLPYTRDENGNRVFVN